MSWVGGRPRTDEGASVIEYLALGVLAAIIVAGLVVVGVPGPFSAGVRDVICLIVEGRRCPAHDLAHRDPDEPDSCLRTQASAATDHNFKIVGYRRNHDVTTTTKRNSDGSISETKSGEGANGVDVRAGIGGKAGKEAPAANVTVGAGYMYNSTYATQLDFTGDRGLGLTPEQQRDRYRGLVTARRRTMTSELAKDPERASDPDFQRRWAQIPRDVAHELHVHTTVTQGGGNDLNVGLDSSVALAGLDGSRDEELLSSRSVDDNGTPGRGDDVTTISFADNEKLNGNGGVSIDPFPKGTWGTQTLAAKGKVSGEYSPVVGYQVRYRQGRPMTLIVTRQRIRSWGTTNKVAVGGGAKGIQQMTGAVSSETASVDLTQHPGVYTALRDYLAAKDKRPESHLGEPAGPGQSPDETRRKEAIRQTGARLNTDIGQVARLGHVDYGRTVSKSGQELSLSRWIELVAGEWTSTNDAWSVKDARYYDRTRGEWVPWVECVAGGGH